MSCQFPKLSNFRPTIFFVYTISVYLHPLHEEGHTFYWLATKWSVEGSNLKSSLNITIKVSGDRVPLQVVGFCLLHSD